MQAAASFLNTGQSDNLVRLHPVIALYLNTGDIEYHPACTGQDNHCNHKNEKQKMNHSLVMIRNTPDPAEHAFQGAGGSHILLYFFRFHSFLFVKPELSLMLYKIF